MTVVDQEFVDARKQSTLQNCPQVLYSPREPPKELKGMRDAKVGDKVGYVTFGRSSASWPNELALLMGPV